MTHGTHCDNNAKEKVKQGIVEIRMWNGELLKSNITDQGTKETQGGTRNLSGSTASTGNSGGPKVEAGNCGLPESGTRNGEITK